MYVYAEEVFIINFAMDFLIAYFVCSLKNHGKPKLKCLMCALTGGVYGVLSLYVSFGIVHKIIICMAMGYIIDGNCFLDTLLSSLLMLLGSFICAGSITALSHICSSTYIMSPEINYAIVFIGSVAGIYIFNKCLFTINRSTNIKENIIYAKINLYDTHTYIYLFNDSGNLLKSQSGKSVIIVDESLFSIFCPGKEIKSMSDDLCEVIDSLPDELKKRTGIITAGGISGEYKMLLLRVDNILLYGDNEKKISPAHIAFARVKDERFKGIINMNLISKEECK